MNSISSNRDLFTQNVHLFRERFPELASLHQVYFTQMPQLPDSWQLITAKDGSITIKEADMLLHSAYAPPKEALQQIRQISDTSLETGIFCSFGLGYAPSAFAVQHPDKKLILIEPDPLRLASAFALFDWKNIFAHPQCILIIGATPDIAIHVLDTVDLSQAVIFSVPAQIRHAQEYFDTLHTLIRRNKQKQEINRRTRDKFSHLWLRNSCINMRRLGELPGIRRLEHTATEYPACVIAAGPSLQNILPVLPQIRDRTILICVDTALRACLRYGIEPDFIITSDPQYWNMRHLLGLSSPSSILITEIAAYPTVFRFPCKQIFLFSSLYPPGKYIEQFCSPLGELSSGGSVASTAWDFARFLGCKNIYVAGLDLGFPDSQTHIKGSLFEERLHADSCRLQTAETETCKALYTDAVAKAENYAGASILTDSRMKLYAWWFESRLATFPDITTRTFCPQGLRIPGIHPYTADDFIKEQPPIDRTALITTLNAPQQAMTQSACAAACRQFAEQLNILLHTARRGQALCEAAINKTHPPYSQVFKELTHIDTEIEHSKVKDIAALVFPAAEQLKKNLKMLPQTSDKQLTAICESAVIYRGIANAAEEYLHYL